MIGGRKRKRFESVVYSDSDSESDDEGDSRRRGGDMSDMTVVGNTINIVADITDVLCLRFVTLLSKLERQQLYLQSIYPSCYTPLIIVRINSPGGNMTAGLSMADTVWNCSVPVRTVVSGQAASAATFVSVSATEKALITPTSTMLIHQLRSGIIGTYKDIQDEKQNCDMYMGVIENMYLDRCPTLTKKRLKRLLQTERVLTATTCKKYGLVDDIVSC